MVASTTLHIAAICLRDGAGRLLLVRKRGTQALILPGGKLEAGESAHAALLRELDEELGLRLPLSDVQPLGRFRAAAANEPNTWVDAQVFQAHLPAATQIAPAAELDALHWLAVDAPIPAEVAPLLRDQVLPALNAAS